jgi:molybdate-binding protein
MDGSADGLNRMKTGEAMAAGIHFHSDDADPNAAHVSAELQDEPVVLIAWAQRSQGLVLAPGVEARALGDLSGRRIVRRQPGSGSHALFERLAADSGLGAGFADAGEPARTESEVAQAVANGRADAGIAIEAAARQFGLGFLPLAIERFDILVWRRDYFEPPFQKLLALTRTPQFAVRAAEFTGYDVSDTGAVRYNGP